MRDDLCHREPEFARLTSDIVGKLALVYPASRSGYTPILLTGSGTAAVEAMVGTLVPKRGAALVVANGVYGERIADMLVAQQKRFELVRYAWHQPLDVDDIERCLLVTAFTCVIAVHHETTTGRLNDVAALGAICRAHDVPLLLDAVSSFGAEELRFEDWNLLACASTANKCLHGVPGISFVLTRNGTLDRESHATSVYLDLARYRREQAAGYSPFTQAVHVMYGLDEALREHADQGGWVARNARYRALSSRVRDGLARLGISTYLERDQVCASMLASYRLPAGTSYDVLHDRLKDAGFVIYAGQGQLRNVLFRIAVMGDLTTTDLDRLIDHIAMVVNGREHSSAYIPS